MPNGRLRFRSFPQDCSFVSLNVGTYASCLRMHSPWTANTSPHPTLLSCRCAPLLYSAPGTSCTNMSFGIFGITKQGHNNCFLCSIEMSSSSQIAEPATTKQRNVEYKNSQVQASSQPWRWVGSGISIAIKSPQTIESRAETCSRTQPCQHMKYPVSVSCYSNSHHAILDATVTKLPETGLKESAKIFTLGQT